MHIKQVIIEGFKSYKDQTITEPFSPKINVVVGANGSGKSNFFHAVRFVLGDHSTNLRAEDRQRLLHEGAGHAALSAYVEVVFDNSDGRLPVDRDEVRLRRAIGLKKDEYYVDKRHVTKKEVAQMLESAGLSAANPYYVVQQGRIAAMANQRDDQRLELLKEIGGTRVYEERRKESVALMRECEGKRAAVDDLIATLDARLGELDAEREELEAYNAADRARRGAEFALLDADAAAAKAALGRLDAEAAAARAAAGKTADGVRDARLKLKAAERELKALGAAAAAAGARRAELAAEREAALRRRAQLEVEIAELEEAAADGGARARAAAADLAAVRAEIAAREGEAAAAAARLADARAAEGEAAAAAAAAAARLQGFYARQGGGKPASKAEREAAARQEVARLEEALATKRDTAAAAAAQAADAAAERDALAAAVAAAEAAAADGEAAAAAAAAEHAALHARRDELQNRQKAAWRREDEAKRAAAELREELKERDRIMQAALPRDISRGLNSVKRLVEQHGIEGVHGLVLELFDCVPQLNTAVEAVAANQLFHVVVEDDAVATRLTDLLVRGRCGRATFMPLNRLNPPALEAPTQWGQDVVPLLSKLRFADAVAPAMRQVFGAALVCRSLALATEVAAAPGARHTCVTLDGDTVERRGALRGGYVDERKSRAEAMREYKALAARVEAAEAEAAGVAAELAAAGQDITAATAELARLAAARDHAAAAAGPARAELRALQERRAAAARAAAAKGAQAAELAAGVAALQADVEARRARGAGPAGELTAAERREMAELQPRLEALQEAAVAAKAARLEAAAAADALEELLSGNLRRRAADLEDEAAAAARGAGAGRAGGRAADPAALEGRRAEAAAARAAAEAAEAAEREADAAADAAARRAKALSDERDALAEAAAADDRAARGEAGRLEELAARRAALQHRRADLERRMRGLGALPAEAVDAFRGRPARELKKELAAAQAALKALGGGVNQQALDQYVTFVEQRDELARRKAENDRAEAKIRALIATLDVRKDEAVERTFKQVARAFREVFAALAPGGRGELVMQRRPAGEAAENEDPGPGGAGKRGADDGGAGDKYVGVKVRVAFAAAGEPASLKQLSGGQKTLVALALIFAIQRCDPAPFYLFDEIDAALDPQYRTTVAALLRAQAADARAPSQFVVTTFHPQLVAVADAVYGVSHRARVSSVTLVQREDAIEFLQAEERRGAAAAAAAAAGRRGGGAAAATEAAAGDDTEDADAMEED